MSIYFMMRVPVTDVSPQRRLALTKKKDSFAGGGKPALSKETGRSCYDTVDV